MKPPVPEGDYLELFVDDAGEHRWRRRDPNGNIVAVSGEGYVSRTYAEVAGVAYNPGLEIHRDEDTDG